MKQDQFIFRWDIVKTLEYVLKLSGWDEKEIEFFIASFLEQEKNNDLDFFEFTDYLKDNLHKNQITYQFIWWTIFWSIYPDFPENKLLEKYYKDARGKINLY